VNRTPVEQSGWRGSAESFEKRSDIRGDRFSGDNFACPRFEFQHAVALALCLFILVLKCNSNDIQWKMQWSGTRAPARARVETRARPACAATSSVRPPRRGGASLRSVV
jgi:hypothetical protein